MPRPLGEVHASQVDVESTTRDLRVTRRAGRSFAAAVSLLLLAALVVNRSGTALVGDSANSNSIVESGTIELSDDDRGRSLFDLRDLTPARPVVRCIAIAYDGSILPVALAMRAEADGPLAEYLDVTIESGVGGGFESCDGFEASGFVYDGVLSELTEREWIDVGHLVNSGEGRTYRIEIAVQDRGEALGLVTSLELAWEVTPS